MPLFEVTLSDASTHIMQAHNKTSLRAALQQQQVQFTGIEQRRRCRRCRKANAAATVQNTLCQPCWNSVLEHCRTTWEDVEMTQQELEDTAMSYFVDA